MALGVSEEHLELAASVRGWAERHCGPGVVRAAAESGGTESGGPESGGTESGGPESGGTESGGPESGGTGSYTDVLRPALARQGLFGLHLPEESGGQGYGLSELAVALEELGQALVPGGFLPTVLASAVLAAARPGDGGDPGGDIGKLLAGLADGSRSGAVALAAGLTGTATDGGLILDGESSPVLAGSLADLVVLPVLSGTQERWAVVDAGDLIVTGLDSLDRTRPLATVRANRVAVPAGRVLPGL